SVGRARQFVASCLGRWGLGALASDSSLVVSELVSNAVVHARTPIELRVRSIEGGIRVEVRDGAVHGFGPSREDQELPEHGLGLRVVARVASRWGVDPMPDGKVVWAAMSAAGAEGPHAPELGLGPAPLPLPDDWPEVRLLHVPARLLLGWEAHTRELIREFSLLAPVPAAHVEGPSSPAPAEFLQDRVAAVKAVLERFWDLVRPVWALAHAAGDGDTGLVTVVTRVPERVVLDAPGFLEAFDDADALASEGRLLTGPTPEEIGEFGRWFVEAVVRQVVEGSDGGGARCPFPP
ncbi:MAG: ATP-binding protein, partial [Acidobacteriota bacterium]|nr:ATP-binding protein [Acidobacteriota bacterium]